MYLVHSSTSSCTSALALVYSGLYYSTIVLSVSVTSTSYDTSISIIVYSTIIVLVLVLVLVSSVIILRSQCIILRSQHRLCVPDPKKSNFFFKQNRIPNPCPLRIFNINAFLIKI